MTVDTNTLTRELLSNYTAYATPRELTEASLLKERPGNVGTSVSLSLTVSASWTWTWTWT